MRNENNDFMCCETCLDAGKEVRHAHECAQYDAGGKGYDLTVTVADLDDAETGTCEVCQLEDITVLLVESEANIDEISLEQVAEMVKEFNEGNFDDIPLMRESFSNLLDSYHADRMISDYTVQNCDNPF